MNYGILTLLQWLIILFQLGTTVTANTESILISIPYDILIHRHLHLYNETIPSISLNNTYMQMETIQIPAMKEDQQVVELKHLQTDASYQLKLSWSAINPIDISNIHWEVAQPRLGMEDDDYPPLFLIFDYDTTLLNNKVGGVSLNIAVVQTKFKIPVDLFPLIAYICLIATGVWYLKDWILKQILYNAISL
ncbi:hypothetical protein NCAS_0G02150 [Naumovozyma castellii]|uniref:Uncharacterized protein n=1 Tax=Naumovozyma castellii TaxID=27288 RepID=G0VI68_NAUCA|nr:hypothetical protein NCAS_0G02150 [Naumovozyma castellii CBS 4309]CCC71102.1 hypothetical protein NCAS_0G02150 [Naumovozyma castellii CBS 4309]